MTPHRPPFMCSEVARTLSGRKTGDVRWGWYRRRKHVQSLLVLHVSGVQNRGVNRKSRSADLSRCASRSPKCNREGSAAETKGAGWPHDEAFRWAAVKDRTSGVVSLGGGRRLWSAASLCNKSLHPSAISKWGISRNDVEVNLCLDTYIWTVSVWFQSSSRFHWGKTVDW